MHICISMKISSININNVNNKKNELNSVLSLHSAPIFEDHLSYSVSFGSSYDFRRNIYKQQKLDRQNELKQKFEDQKAINPDTAFLYNPEISVSKKLALVDKCLNIKSLPELSEKLNVPQDVARVWIKGGSIKAEQPDDKSISKLNLVDINVEQNKLFLEMLKQEIPKCIPAMDFMISNNIKEDEFRKLLKNQEILPLGVSFIPGLGLDNLLINPKDPKNQEKLVCIHKTKPVPSATYYKSEKVPVTYLSKLGFGNTKMLARMVMDGNLPGDVEKRIVNDEIKYSVNVNTSSISKTQFVLKQLRDKNEEIVELNELAKNMGVAQKEVRFWLQNDDLKIINEFIFPDDCDKVYININDQKNKEFLEETRLRLDFEKKLEQEQQIIRKEMNSELTKKAQLNNDRESSLRMKIAWHLCPSVREALSIEARSDKHIGLIIAKEENGEELLPYEKKVLISYYKSVWQDVDAKIAFKQSVNQAMAIIDQIKKEGIDSLDDFELVEIVKNYESVFDAKP